jgi:hypothetical protein
MKIKTLEESGRRKIKKENRRIDAPHNRKWMKWTK